MPNEHQTNVPGLEKERPRNIDVDTPENIPYSYVLINGIPTPQTIRFCPECGDPRIEMEAKASFRLTNQHVWGLIPFTQEELITMLNQQDNACECSECGWTGTFSELLE